MKSPIAICEEFRHRIAAGWGASGEQWLERLPALIATCEARWELSVQAAWPRLSYNFVATAVRKDGAPAILKIGVPNPELHTEIEALWAFCGRPAVRLLEADHDLGALLLARISPGRPLSDLSDDDEATAIAAGLIRDLPAPPPPAHSFPTVARWALAFERYRATFPEHDGPLPLRLVEKAERLFTELQASGAGEMLLHGDLHHENILYDEEAGWVAIDPKGVIGEPAYEAARLQHNPIPGFLAIDRPRLVAERRLAILSEVLGVDRGRLLAWAYFDVALSACWTVEEAGDVTYALRCAEIFAPLVN
jgi:streptomycin 6-kinase